MRIDAHQHFWSFDPAQFPWISAEMAVLRRDYHVAQAVALLDAHGFDSVVAVQARADWMENAWLLAVAKQSSRVAGVVGWADMCHDAAHAKLDEFLSQPESVGVRAMLQDMADPVLVLQSNVFNDYVKQIQQHGQVYELLLRHDQLEGSVAFSQKNDRHMLVVDHLAKPDYQAGLASEQGLRWQQYFHQLGELPHVYVKVSGLLTEVEASTLEHIEHIDELFHPFLDVALACFGAQRLVFGSDWPVAYLRGGYDVGLGVIERWAKTRLSTAEAEQLFGGNAQRLYSR